MINFNELRIGNCVEHDNRYFKIHSIAKVFPTLDTIEFGIGVVDWNNITAIPLTEEIILKCGFVKQIFKMSGCFIYQLERIIIMKSYANPNDIFSLTIEGISPKTWSIASFKYLHQIQNLYCALTGTELTVNL